MVRLIDHPQLGGTLAVFLSGIDAEHLVLLF
jgi:hypothetical protein